MKNNNKYHNKKVTIDNIRFDSIKEAGRYRVLKLLERAGEISDLKLQPKFELQPKFKINGKTERAIHYIADFGYRDNKLNKDIVEDVKSEATRKDKVYRLKKKMFLYKYGNLCIFKEV